MTGVRRTASVDESLQIEGEERRKRGDLEQKKRKDRFYGRRFSFSGWNPTCPSLDNILRRRRKSPVCGWCGDLAAARTEEEGALTLLFLW